MPGMNLTAVEAKPFVPASDFERAKEFHLAVGFEGSAPQARIDEEEDCVARMRTEAKAAGLLQSRNRATEKGGSPAARNAEKRPPPHLERQVY